MIETQRHKRLYGLHEWMGILFGLFLFMLSFTGTVAVFYDELRFWESPELRPAAGSQQYVEPDGLLTEYLDSFPEGTHFHNLFLSVPSSHVGTYVLFGGQHPPAVDGEEDPPLERFEVHWNARTGEQLDDHRHGLAHWLRDIHRDLMLPNRSLGRMIVGFAGLLMLVSIVSGVLTHQKILREMFTLRVGKSKRLQWKDTHNALGTWALPFHAMIAFSGAYLGLVVLLLPIFAFTAFKGDQDAAIKAVLGDEAEPAGIVAEPYPLSSALLNAQESTGYEVAGMALRHYGDANAEYEIFLHPDDRLQISTAFLVSGASGSEPLTSASDGGDETTSEIVLNAMTALHYATYGGIWLKVLYVGLGLVLCIMIATGIMVWVERRAYGPVGSMSPATYLRIGRFSAGAMMGLPLATLAVFYADRLSFVAADKHLALIGWTYMGIWMLTTVIGLLMVQTRLFVRSTLVISGVMAVGILPLDALTLGQASLLDADQRIALGFNLGILLLGVMSLMTGVWFNRFYNPGTDRTNPVNQSGDWTVSAV